MLMIKTLPGKKIAKMLNRHLAWVRWTLKRWNPQDGTSFTILCCIV